MCLSGTTSVDLTKPGIYKAYLIGKLRDLPGISIQEMIFIDDALIPGGNEYPTEVKDVISIGVKNPNEAQRVIETTIAYFDDVYDSPVNNKGNNHYVF